MVTEAKQARLLKPSAVNARKYFIIRDHQSASGSPSMIREYRNSTASQSISGAVMRSEPFTEASVINLELSLGRLGLVAIRSAAIAAAVLAQTTIQQPSAHASNETATRPWSAPVGHRQPQIGDVTASTASSIDEEVKEENARIDQLIKGVCRGC